MTNNNELDKKIFSLEFSVSKSIRYHMKRVSFIQFWQRIFKITLLLSGSGAFFSLASKNTELAFYGSMVVAIVAATENAINLPENARIHNNLYKKFFNLSIKMNKDNNTEENYLKWRQKRFQIEREQPPELDALNVRCHNEECESRDLLEDIRKIGLIQRLFIHLFSFQKEFPKKELKDDSPEKIVEKINK